GMPSVVGVSIEHLDRDQAHFTVALTGLTGVVDEAFARFLMGGAFVSAEHDHRVHAALVPERHREEEKVAGSRLAYIARYERGVELPERPRVRGRGELRGDRRSGIEPTADGAEQTVAEERKVRIMERSHIGRTARWQPTALLEPGRVVDT